MLDTPGYDAATGLLYRPDGCAPSVPARPSLDDARVACATLKDVLCDFPFATGPHRSAALAGILTPLVRHAFAGSAPLFLVDANTRGAGKSLLCDVAATIATGRSAARMTCPADDAEMNKCITALALAGDLLVLIDNIATVFGFASLDAALTGTTWRGRILGVSEMTAELPLYATWYATGNNVTLGADVARRVLHIRLDSPEERPEERAEFRHPHLLPWVQAERARLVAAALTVARAYHLAGRPDVGLRPWGSFEGWSALVRAALVWAGEPDPAATRDELVSQSDIEMNALGTLHVGLEELDPAGNGVLVADMIGAVALSKYERLRTAFDELIPHSERSPRTARRVGMKLHHLRKRVVAGRWLDRADSRMGALWMVRHA